MLVTFTPYQYLDVIVKPSKKIRQISANFFAQQGVMLQQTHLPLVPCWAATIHKVQCLSLDSAVIDLVPKMFEDGMY